jgi:acyl carrier protein
MSKALRARLVTIFADNLGGYESDITDGSRIIADLGADSLDVVDLIMQVEEIFDVELDDERLSKIVTFGDAVAYLDELLLPNPIDSLPPTDERVGMPTVGDASYCVPCDFYEVIRRDMIDDDGAVACRWCGSFDLSGHGVASLRGVRHGT